jgi:hypothetical protein
MVPDLSVKTHGVFGHSARLPARQVSAGLQTQIMTRTAASRNEEAASGGSSGGTGTSKPSKVSL